MALTKLLVLKKTFNNCITVEKKINNCIILVTKCVQNLPNVHIFDENKAALL